MGHGGDICLCSMKFGRSTRKTKRQNDFMVGAWNHPQVYTLIYLLLGQGEWETRTSNPSDDMWLLLAAWLGFLTAW